MRSEHVALVALGLLSACGPDAAAPTGGLGRRVEGGTLVEGTAFGLTPPPDSVEIGVPNAQVVFMRVGDLPPDSGGINPDSGTTNPNPPDSGGINPDSGTINPNPPESLTVHAVRQVAIHGGSILPLDTLPPDSGGTPPPPPPPPFGCGHVGDTLAITVTGSDGGFKQADLPEGLYDIQVAAKPGSGYGVGFACSQAVRAGSPLKVSIWMPPRP
ncbi:MAG TPA: hypothetical protein VMG41_09405 [Gemmatimonadales bacterium]|nr:hypothetical protein [Gemmatimonadales bacterium]